MSSWLFVLGQRDALAWVLEHKQMAFRDHIRADKLAKGDRFAIYVTRGAMGNPTRDESQIVATGTLTTELVREPIEIAGEEYGRHLKFRFDVGPKNPREGLAFVPLVPKLTWISKKDHWMAYIRKALVPIPDEDFATIEAALKKL